MIPFLQRIIGFDQDLRSIICLIHVSIAHRYPMIICGDGDLVPIARSFHSHVIGGPFIVCDPRRKHTKTTVRSAENIGNGMMALAAASNGSICIRSSRPPDDIDKIMSQTQTQIIVCSHNEPFYVSAIRIPSLAHRQHEIDLVISSYANDALQKLSATADRFTSNDHAWVKKYACDSLAEIEKATIRIVALRIARNQTHAAEILGMAPISLMRWIDRKEQMK